MIGHITRREAEKLTGKRRTSLVLWLGKNGIKPEVEIRKGKLYYLYCESEILRVQRQENSVQKCLKK